MEKLKKLELDQNSGGAKKHEINGPVYERTWEGAELSKVEGPYSKEVLEKQCLFVDTLISDLDSLRGFGNTGFVYKIDGESRTYCVKVQWDDIYIDLPPDIENIPEEKKPEAVENLPENMNLLKNLYKIKRYKDEVSRQTKARMEKGNYGMSINVPFIGEVKRQQELAQKADEAGFKNMIPMILHVVFVEKNNGYGQGDDGEVAASQEKREYAVMEYIDGPNIEEFISDPEEDEGIRNYLKDNFEVFEKRIKDLITFMHKEMHLFHNDITVRNIMIDRETFEPRLIDFGKTTNVGSEDEEEKALDSVLNWLKRSLLGDPNDVAEEYKKLTR